MNTGITTRGDETLDASKTVVCEICGAHAAHERFDLQKFSYGQDGVILSAIVAVTECTACEMAYTGEDGEIHRELAVRNHLQAVAASPSVGVPDDTDNLDAWKQAIRKDVEERFGPIPDDLVPAGEAAW
ncbi:hypothetical protein [Rhizobium sp. BK176]|uniref:hypothetical protein n=1 Tax=Rhizobium sp. BK176 TaxID=2587071 RepID=UPI00216777AF|nr:hypothetical protein [Rhizobium sp. BK176]MCS4089641.1 hypothetical protein [Rhizobium sp. BK176]